MAFGLWAQTPDPAITYRDAAMRVGSQTLHVLVADTPQSMEQGLMYRDSIAPHDGMLFIFSAPQQISFWMKDTYMPLDVGYFDSHKKLLEIHALKPLDETPVPSESSDILYALELPSGNFAKKGLKVGDSMEYKTLDTSQKVLQ